MEKTDPGQPKAKPLTASRIGVPHDARSKKPLALGTKNTSTRAAGQLAS